MQIDSQSIFLTNITYDDTADIVRWRNQKFIQEYLELPYVPAECQHNAHMFYIKLKDLDQRTQMLDYLRKKGIYAVFHYVPLHSSKAGKEFVEFVGDDIYTTKESDRLLRLPMFYGLSMELSDYVIDCIHGYFR